MAKYSNVVEYNIVTDVDTSGIIKLQNELTKLKQSLKFDKNGFSQLGFDDAKIENLFRRLINYKLLLPQHLILKLVQLILVS